MSVVVPTPAPELSVRGERLRERTAYMARDDELRGHAHAYLCGVLGLALEQVAAIFDPPEPVQPGGPLVSIDMCPPWALPWLAQMLGIRLPGGVSVDDARTILRSVGGWKRGTRASLIAAAELYLTGSRRVLFRERDESPYRLEVVTLIDETPDVDRVRRALLAQKPAGLVLAYTTVAAWDYEEARLEGGTYAALRDRFADYLHLALRQPT